CASGDEGTGGSAETLYF
nr:T-cell receptor V beta CDR3 region {clone V8Inm8} [mice, NOD, islets, Peptide Partial, 17 aa] [Mus sp.]